MIADQYYFLFLWSILTIIPFVLHATRANITLGVFFGFMGICSIMLWQILQIGWWVHFYGFSINSAFALIIPPIVAGSLLTFAFDGLRTFRSYLFMVTGACIIAFLFSIFREALSIYVPLPYLIELSNKEHIAIIGALFFTQIFATMAYVLLSRIKNFPALVLALPLSLIFWIVFYSVFKYGHKMGMVNLNNELFPFILSGIPSFACLGIYSFFMRSQHMVMPIRSLNSLFAIWRVTESNHSERKDEMTNRKDIISELRMLNQQLEINNKVIEYHMKNASYGILITDKSGKIRRANEAAQKLLSNSKLTGFNIDAILNPLFNQEHSFDELLRACDGRRWKIDLESEKTRWYELIVTHLKSGESSNSTGYYFVIRDATSIVEDEALTLAKHRVKDLKETSRVLTHDFSNLLIGADAQLRKIKNKTEDPDTHEAIVGLSAALKNARDMLNQLDTGSQFGAPVFKTWQVIDLIKQSIDICRAVSQEIGIELILDIKENLIVEADTSQLIRVFTNLIRNAMTASQPNSVININARRRGGGVEINFVDQGHGMTEEQTRLAFDPGFSSKGEGKGGLGLAISYLMIDAHGGTIDLKRNADGIGVTSTVWLPESSRKILNLNKFSNQNIIVFSKDANKTQKYIAELELLNKCYVAEAYTEDEVMALVNDLSDWDVILIDDLIDSLDIETKLRDKINIEKITFN